MLLETERLILSPWGSADWLAFRPIARDPEVMRYITGGEPWSDEQIRSFADRQIGLYRNEGFCRWKLTEKSTGAMIGFCGAGYWRDAPDPEIGWWLASACWQRGYATEAARATLRDAFGRARMTRIISIARPENAASIRIMEKLGLRLDTEFERDGVRLVRYAIHREDYLKASVVSPA
jgi:ribosomal-protein-alanine N-acetyltransferase